MAGVSTTEAVLPAALEDFLKEINDIEEDSTEHDDNHDDDSSKTPDEGEQEMAWLKDAGYGHLVSKLEEGREIEDEAVSKETASLTRKQADAVIRRLEKVNTTLRQRRVQKGGRKVDVRNIFDQPHDNDSSKDTCSVQSGKVSRRSTKRPEHPSFLKKKGVYAVDPTCFDEPDTDGVQTISIQSKGVAESRPRPDTHKAVSSHSEQEAYPSFSIENKKGSEEETESMDGGLPVFILQKVTLGITRVSDLIKPDLDRVKTLALIELTALFDTNNLNYVRQKPKKRLKDHGIFGVPLATLLEHDQKRNPQLTVPRIFLELINHLEKTGVEEEGILRVPGAQTRIKSCRAEIESRFNSDRFQWEEVMPNDAAGLLKQFIRELPVPLLTFDYLDAFAQVEGVQDIMTKLQALNLLVLLLPDVHRNTLRMLLSFLKKVVDKEENLMNLHNVSMIMAPNLFLVAPGRRKKPDIKGSELRMAAVTSNIVRMLIKYQDLLWTIPAFMIAQIRQKYEADQLRKFKDKSIMKLLGRKDKAETYRKPAIHQETDYQEGVIRVLCPHINKYLTPIQLDANTTAQDVVNRFRRRTVAHPPSAEKANGKYLSREVRGNSAKGELPHEELHIYEVGGNIGERRLDPCTMMLPLLRVNPNAEWIVRTSRD